MLLRSIFAELWCSQKIILWFFYKSFLVFFFLFFFLFFFFFFFVYWWFLYITAYAILIFFFFLKYDIGIFKLLRSRNGNHYITIRGWFRDKINFKMWPFSKFKLCPLVFVLKKANISEVKYAFKTKLEITFQTQNYVKIKESSCGHTTWIPSVVCSVCEIFQKRISV